MASIGVFTIASKNYLAYVRVLLESVARIHPEYKLFLCLADRVDNHFDPSKEPYSVVLADQIGIPGFADFTLRYDIMEFNTAVKPFMFRWLFDNTDLDAVIYLDPDIQTFSRFDRVESELTDGASVVLTPHITQPLEDGKTPNDYHMLQAGVFNLGFIAARRCRESLDFMDWWGRRLQAQCIADLHANLFVDQKWCDLAPCLIENLAILRDTGYNVAYWNLTQRRVSRAANGQWCSNESPLVFFHFSGVSPSDKRLVSKHQNRLSWNDIPEAQPLFEAYNSALMQAGWKDTHTWPYAYGDSDGWGKSVVKLLYRDEQPYPADVTAGDLKEYLKGMCNQPSPDVPTDSDVRISKLMHRVYRLRTDLQAAFSLDASGGRKQFASWFEEAASREYGLPRELTQQHLIVEGADSLQHKTGVTTLAYQTMTTLEPTAIAIAKLLPTGVRSVLKRYWVALRSRILRGF